MRRDEILRRFKSDVDAIGYLSDRFIMIKGLEYSDMPIVFEYVLSKFNNANFDYKYTVDNILGIFANYAEVALLNVNYGHVTIFKMKVAIERVIKHNYGDKGIDILKFDLDIFNELIKDYVDTFGNAYEQIRSSRIKRLFNDLETVQILVNKYYDTVKLGNREGDKVDAVMRKLGIE